VHSRARCEGLSEQIAHCGNDCIWPLTRQEMASHGDHTPLIPSRKILGVVLRLLRWSDAVAGAMQHNPVRGLFSGTLKKKLGLEVASAREERGRVYRIAEPASA